MAFCMNEIMSFTRCSSQHTHTRHSSSSNRNNNKHQLKYTHVQNTFIQYTTPNTQHTIFIHIATCRIYIFLCFSFSFLFCLKIDYVTRKISPFFPRNPLYVSVYVSFIYYSVMLLISTQTSKSFL